MTATPGPVRQRPNVVGGLTALAWLVVVAVPLFFVVATSLRESGDYLEAGPLSVPAELSLANYVEVLQSEFVRYFVNNVVVTLACVTIVLGLSLPAAYAVVRSPNPSVARVFSVLLIGLAVPSQAVIVPVYLLITQLHLYDSLLAVILPTAAFSLPLSVVVLTSSLRDIPRELFEAAHLDGAGPWRALWSVVVPLSRAGMATVGIFAAMQAWNGFLFPLVLTQSASVRTLTLGLWDLQGQYGLDVPLIMATVMLSVLPLLMVYLVGRRWLLAGLTAGTGK